MTTSDWHGVPAAVSPEARELAEVVVARVAFGTQSMVPLPVLIDARIRDLLAAERRRVWLAAMALAPDAIFEAARAEGMYGALDYLVPADVQPGWAEQAVEACLAYPGWAVNGWGFASMGIVLRDGTRVRVSAQDARPQVQTREASRAHLLAAALAAMGAP